MRGLHEDRRLFTYWPDVLRKHFRKAANAVGLGHVRFHDLRHTAITNLRRSGADVLTIKEISGHKTLSAFDRYNSFRHADLNKVAEHFHRFTNTQITPASSATKVPTASR